MFHDPNTAHVYIVGVSNLNSYSKSWLLWDITSTMSLANQKTEFSNKWLKLCVWPLFSYIFVCGAKILILISSNCIWNLSGRFPCKFKFCSSYGGPCCFCMSEQWLGHQHPYIRTVSKYLVHQLCNLSFSLWVIFFLFISYIKIYMYIMWFNVIVVFYFMCFTHHLHVCVYITMPMQIKTLKLY